MKVIFLKLLRLDLAWFSRSRSARLASGHFARSKRRV